MKISDMLHTNIPSIFIGGAVAAVYLFYMASQAISFKYTSLLTAYAVLLVSSVFVYADMYKTEFPANVPPVMRDGLKAMHHVSKYSETYRMAEYNHLRAASLIRHKPTTSDVIPADYNMSDNKLLELGRQKKRISARMDYIFLGLEHELPRIDEVYDYMNKHYINADNEFVEAGEDVIPDRGDRLLFIMLSCIVLLMTFVATILSHEISYEIANHRKAKK